MARKKAARTPPKSPATPSRIAKSLDVLGKVLLSGAIVFGILFCIGIVAEWRSGVGSKNSQRNVASLTQQRPVSYGATHASFGTEGLLSGDWVFADLPWSIQVQELPYPVALEALNTPARTLKLETSNGKGTSAESADLGLVMQMMLASGAEESNQDGNAVYRVDTEMLKAVAYAPVDAPQQIQIAKVMQSYGEGLWNYIEIQAQATGFAHRSTSQETLLPMGPGVERLAVRLTADHQQVCGELYAIGHSVEELYDTWRAEGWKLQQLSELATGGVPSAVASYPHFEDSKSLDSTQVIACVREGEMVVVIPPPASAQSSNMLLVVRP